MPEPATRAAERAGTPGPAGASALDLLPLVDPVLIGRAIAAAAVDTILLRRRPVVDLSGELLVGRVVDVAEILLAGVFTRLRLRGRLTEVLGHLSIHLG